MQTFIDCINRSHTLNASVSSVQSINRKCTVMNVPFVIDNLKKSIICGLNDIFGVGVNSFSQDQQEFMILEIFRSCPMHQYLSVMVGICFR